MQGAEKMGVEPVNKLLIKMALPMMLSLMVIALYNIVDSIFVARISEDALTAVSMAFPMQTLLMASSSGTAVGLNALLSRSLGEGNREDANKSVVNALFLCAVTYLIFLVVGIFFVKPFYVLQTGSVDSVITQYGVEYLRCVLIFSFGVYAEVIFERTLTATGRTVLCMITQLIGAIVNLILDPILIFGLLGFPAMGVRGAAVATVIGEIMAAVAAYILNVTKNTDITLTFKGFRPDKNIIRTILIVGIPSMIMQAIGSVMVFGFNKILVYFSTTAVAVFGIFFKINSMVFMPVFGINMGMIPIVAYNYGAKNRDRMIKAIGWSIVYAAVIMIVGVSIIELIPDKILMLFNASENMLEIGVPALRIICLSMLLASPSIIFSSSFQALGYGVYSMFISLIRQLLVLLPAAAILAVIAYRTTGDVTLVWWSFDIAEIAAISASLSFYMYTYRTVIKPLPKGND